MSAPRSLTANYGVQYQLTLATARLRSAPPHIAGASTGDWFDSGSTVNLTADLNVAKDTGERYHFSAWSGASTATTVGTSVTMSAPRSLTANYGVQYLLTLNTSPAGVGSSNPSASPAGDSGWYDSGASVSVSATAIVPKASGERYRFDHWSGDASGSSNPVSVTMGAPKTVTAVYVTQYQLTLATAPAAVGTSHIAGAATGDWFDSGTVVNLTAELNVAKATGERYHFSAWSGASTATTVATSVTMSAPRSLTANYGVQYQLTLRPARRRVGSSNPSASPAGDSGWYDSGARS